MQPLATLCLSCDAAKKEKSELLHVCSNTITYVYIMRAVKENVPYDAGGGGT
jgi:hypothetical protein